MVKMWRSAACTMAFAGILAGLPDAATAQRVSGVGVVEYDTNETLLLLAGVSAGRGGDGWSPIVGLQAHYLSFDRGAERADIISVRPSVGLRKDRKSVV